MLVRLLSVTVAITFSATTHAADVHEVWLDRLDGPASMNDYGDAIAVAPDGSVYVAGSVFEQVSDNGFAPRFMTIKYDAAGTRMWTRTYAGTFASGGAAAGHIGIDGNGDILVAGSTNQGDDWAVVKYDPQGNELWRSVYQANSTFLTKPDDMAIDAAGNVYLAGYLGDHLNPDAGAVVKFTPDGVEAWQKRYYGPTFDGANFSSVAVDDDGHVYAAGGASVPGRAGEMAIVQYDSNGTFLWADFGGYPGTFTYDRALALAVDSQGHAIVAGQYGVNSVLGVDLVVAKYDVAGTKLWEQLYVGPDNRTDAATALAVDSQDDIVVVGYSGVALNDYAALTLKYDANGGFQWERRVSGDDIHFDWASSVTVDPAGNVYTVGSYDPIGGSRFFTVRYDGDGTEAWFMDYDGPLGGGSRANAVAFFGESVYVTGESPDDGTDFDIATIRYDQTVAPVTGDVDGDGVVDFGDLIAVLSTWGTCADCGVCPADLNGDCRVTLTDLLIVLSNWS